MKTTINARQTPTFPLSHFLTCLLFLALIATPSRAADDLSAVLQRGLFEEEANNNLAAAIKAYEAVVTATDAQRKLAGTALFRLAECYRKLGRTNDAVTHYQRVAREYPDQTRLVDLSRQNLVGLGAVAAADATTSLSKAGRAEQKRLLEEEVGIVETDLKRLEDLVKSRLASSDQLSPKQRELLALRRQLAALADASSEASTASAPTDEEEKEVRRILGLIKDSPDLINARDNLGQSPLHKAAAAGQLRVAEFLLANGADVNAPSLYNGAPTGPTPLRQAASAGHKKMVELLLAKGASVTGNSSTTPLHDAASRGYRSVVEVLLDHKADVNDRAGSYDSAPLHEAVERGFSGVAQVLIARGADVNALRRGASLNPQSTMMVSAGPEGAPLHIAAWRGDIPMIELLVTNKADVNLRSPGGFTPLHAAVVKGFPAAVLAFLSAGADINANSRHASSGKMTGRNALHFAAANGRLDLVELLLDKDADPNRLYDPDGASRNYSALYFVLADRPKDYLPMAKALLEHKANPNQTNSNVSGPIHLSVHYFSDKPALELLLQHGADVELKNAEGRTALNLGRSRTTKEIYELLLAHKANPNTQDKQYGYTPLHWLVDQANQTPQPPSQGQPDFASFTVLAEMLLAHGADPNLRSATGRTPLNLFGVPANPQSSLGIELAAVLRKHGAKDEMLEPEPDPETIRVWRKGQPAARVVFYRDQEGRNRFTLLETVLNFYNLTAMPEAKASSRKATGPAVAPGASVNFRPIPGRAIAQPSAGPQYSPAEDIPFPDFSRVRIQRVVNAEKNEKKIIELDLLNARGEFDCAKDQWLEFGDVVEIPEREYRLNEQKTGLTSEQANSLFGCLQRRMTWAIKGQRTEVEFTPMRSWAYLSVTPDWPEVRNALRSTSDLTRMTLKRTDPVTKEKKEFLISIKDLRRGDSARYADVWLRDGDMIEVPERDDK